MRNKIHLNTTKETQQYQKRENMKKFPNGLSSSLSVSGSSVPKIITDAFDEKLYRYHLINQ